MKFFFVYMCCFMLLSTESCKNRVQHGCTPPHYLNAVKAPKGMYSTDSLNVVEKIKSYMMYHQGFFYSEEYFAGTYIIIDTIIYNRAFNKLVILVVSKNPVSRQMIPSKTHHSYFDGTCYLGLKSGSSLNLSWLGPNFTNYYDRRDLSRLMRETYFCNFANPRNPTFGNFNLNDTRFLETAEWNKHFHAK